MENIMKQQESRGLALVVATLVLVIVSAGCVFNQASENAEQHASPAADEFTHCLNGSECEKKVPAVNNESGHEGSNAATTFKVANWNLQVFGKTKASNESLMRFYASKIRGYDIVFVQEIRDSTGTAFPALCGLLKDDGYSCRNSSRAGRSSSKEQYGVIYKTAKNISITEFTDYNPDPEDRWERPPILVAFTANNYSLTAYNIHIKPEDVANELHYLEETVNKYEGNVVILGDLNADCSYYTRTSSKDFVSGFHWIVKDADDTTVSETDCAYDRIILNDEADKRFVSYGIDKEGVTKDISDHYLVWVELNEM